MFKKNIVIARKSASALQLNGNDKFLRGCCCCCCFGRRATQAWTLLQYQDASYLNSRYFFEF